MKNNGNDRVEILLVEDSDLDAELTMKALKNHKLSNNVVRLKNGEEAINYLFGKGEFKDRNTKKKPKLILLDLKMPKVSGLEVLKAIRENKETKELPVVMMTSSKEEKDVVQSYSYGVNSYIVKPVEFEVFTKAVNEIGFYWLILNQTPE